MDFDPRTPGKPVPASVKWINDQIDEIVPMLEHDKEHKLRDYVSRSHHEIAYRIRRQDGDFLCRYIEMSSVQEEEEEDKWIKIGELRRHNVDNWDQKEAENLERILCSLSVIGLCKTLHIDGSPAHATIKLRIRDSDIVIDVIVVSGRTHEACFEYAKKYLQSEQRYAIVVIRDKHGLSLPDKFGLVYELPGEIDPNGPYYYGVPNKRFIPCNYQDVINCCQSGDLDKLKVKVREVIRI